MLGFNKHKIYKTFSSRIFVDSFWAVMGSISTRGLSLLSGIFIAKILGKTSFGEYGMLKNSVLTMTVFTTLGLGYTSTAYISKFKNYSRAYQVELIKSIFAITCGISCLLMILCIFFSKDIALYYFKNELIYYKVQIVSIWLVFNAVTSILTGMIAGYGLFKKFAKINVFVGIAGFILNVLCTYWFDLDGALIGLVLSQIIICVVYLIIVINYIRFTYSPTNEIVSPNNVSYKDLITNSVPIAIQELLYTVVSWTSYAILIHYTNYGEIGAYNVAMQWLGFILFIPSILNNVILSYLSRSATGSQNSIIKQMLVVNILSTFIPSVTVFFFSDYIVNIYGSTYQGISHVLSIVVFTSIFMAVINVFTQQYVANNKSWIMFCLKLLKDISMLIILFSLICFSNVSGSEAFAYASLFSNVIFMLILIYKFKIEK